ncbi:cation:proton antiporter [Aldersonia sp. NBC_00410]|uniref:cation:proton antiporter n=1 Tax=Aldersonia sp. NBC_00410 TaxID=2975954 RepID=UPI0022560265|nr:cation:proton antiporter [Aldersonia sp. NBC_00410]MCX5043496.1 cation:proton antiporter [Aldersonia sp. NBC_00410]
MTWALPAIAAVLLAYSAISRRSAGTPITAPIIFTVAGLVLGATAVGLIDVHASAEAVKLLAEVTLTLVLFADASQVDLSALRTEIALPARLLGIGLPLTIAAGFGAALLVLDLTWPEALLLAVILAPTDAALGQAVVTLPILPSRVRQGLNVESGLNDGICVPLFLIVLEIAQAEAGVAGGGARLLIEQIGYGILTGLVAGGIGAAILITGGRSQFVDPLWARIIPVAAALLAYTAAVPLGGSGFIAAFFGGLTFGAIRRRAGDNDADEADVLDAAGGVFSAMTFIVFGAVLLGPALDNLSWAIAGYAVLSLTVVRMLPVALSLIGTHARAPTVAFVGWFGPRGLATIVFVILIVEEPGELPHEGLLLTTAIITIAISVLAHGLSAAPLADRYAGWFQRHPHLEDRQAPNTGG